MAARVNFKLAYGGQKHRFASTLLDDALFRVVKAKVSSIVGKDKYELFWNDGNSNVVLESVDDLFAAIDWAKGSRENASKPPCVQLHVDDTPEVPVAPAMKELEAVPASMQVTSVPAAEEQLQATAAATTPPTVPQAVQEFLAQLDRLERVSFFMESPLLRDELQLKAIHEGMQDRIPELTPAHREIGVLVKSALASKPQLLDRNVSVQDKASLLLENWIERAMRESFEATPITLAALHIIAKAGGETFASMQKVVELAMQSDGSDEKEAATSNNTFFRSIEVAALIFEAGIAVLNNEPISGPMPRAVEKVVETIESASNEDQLGAAPTAEKPVVPQAVQEFLAQLERFEHISFLEWPLLRDENYRKIIQDCDRDRYLEEPSEHPYVKPEPSPAHCEITALLSRAVLSSPQLMEEGRSIREMASMLLADWIERTMKDSLDASPMLQVALHIIARAAAESSARMQKVVEELSMRTQRGEIEGIKETLQPAGDWIRQTAESIFETGMRVLYYEPIGGPTAISRAVPDPTLMEPMIDKLQALLATVDLEQEEDEEEDDGDSSLCGEEDNWHEIACLSEAQEAAMEQVFKYKLYPGPQERRRLATEMAISTEQVRLWFIDRRDQWRSELRKQNPNSTKHICDLEIEHAEELRMMNEDLKSIAAYQAEVLEKSFLHSPYEDAATKEELAMELELTEYQIKTWFQNRRKFPLRSSLPKLSQGLRQILKSMEPLLPPVTGKEAEHREAVFGLLDNIPTLEGLAQIGRQFSALKKNIEDTQKTLSTSEIAAMFSLMTAQAASSSEEPASYSDNEWDSKYENDLHAQPSVEVQQEWEDQEHNEDCDDSIYGEYAAFYEEGPLARIASAEQEVVLEKYFALKLYPSYDERQELANQLELTMKQVRRWFVNRRDQWRRELKEKNSYSTKHIRSLEIENSSELLYQWAALTFLTPDQEKSLETNFEQASYEDAAMREQLAKELDLSEYQIKIWFSNRRLRNQKEKAPQMAQFKAAFAQEFEKRDQMEHVLNGPEGPERDEALHSVMTLALERVAALEKEGWDFSGNCMPIPPAAEEPQQAAATTPHSVDQSIETAGSGSERDWDKVEEQSDREEAVLYRVSEDDKTKIEMEACLFNKLKNEVEQEIQCSYSEWNDGGLLGTVLNISAILGDMVEFMAGRGTYKSKDCVIRAARAIGQLGQRLFGMARQMGDMAAAANSANKHFMICKKDMDGHLYKLSFFCHRMSTSSAVPEAISDSSSFNSVLDLIQDASNILTTVASAVKSLYVVCTKFHSGSVSEKAWSEVDGEWKKNSNKSESSELDSSYEMPTTPAKETLKIAPISTETEVAAVKEEETKEEVAHWEAEQAKEPATWDAAAQAQNKQEDAEIATELDQKTKERELKIREKALAIKEEAFERKQAEWAIKMEEMEKRMESMKERIARKKNLESRMEKIEATMAKVEEAMEDKAAASADQAVDTPQNSAIDCHLCGETLRNPIMVKCPSKDAHKFCMECTRKHIIQNVARLDVFCPSGEMCHFVNLAEPWTYVEAEIKMILGDEGYEAYKMLRAIAGL